MRSSYARLVALAIVISTVVGAVIAWRARNVNPFRSEVRDVVVQLPRNHQNLSGLTIAFVTDTHVGPHFRADALQPIVKHLLAIQPDIVLFGGDYICESPRFIREAAPLLGQMAGTARFGAWGVMGNHDLSNTRGRVMPPLEDQGISLLANQAVEVETARGVIWIVGIDDALVGSPDIEAAFRDVPVDAAAICLWHEPDRADDSAPFGPFLQLSGHSHGGQVNLPFIGPVATPKMGKRYVSGRFQIEDMELYVSPGIGIYRPPVRLNCPPELTIIHLVE